MLTLPITLGKKYVRRDGKTITAEIGLNMPISGEICVATEEEARSLGLYPGDRLAYPKNGHVLYDLAPHPYDLVADAEPVADTHPHAALIDQYAQDWKTCSEPWKHWEFLSASSGWEPLTTHPFWLSDMQYRRKPAKETVTINGKTINAPMRQAPKTVTKAWHLSLQAPYVIEVWPEMPQEAFDKNVIFYTKEDAEAARLAIIAALGTSKEIT